MRSVRLPKFFEELFPEYDGQSLEEFLDKMDRIEKGETVRLKQTRIVGANPWSAYDKMSQVEKDKLFTKIKDAIRMKANKSTPWVSKNGVSHRTFQIGGVRIAILRTGTKDGIGRLRGGKKQIHKIPRTRFYRLDKYQFISSVNIEKLRNP